MLHFNLTSAALLLISWLNDNAEALCNAAQLLGGLPAARRTARLIGDLRASPDVTRRIFREVKCLQDLLNLEHVHDEERDEFACFMAIDPADPVVYEICSLTDGLRDRLEAYEREARIREMEKVA